jgi:DNA-binding NtrC family response regulator
MKRESILVVDDERLLRDFLREALARAGYVVGTADGGDAAIDALAADRYDLVLLDVSMPGRSGLETLQEIRRLRADLPVVMMTAYGTIDSAVAAMRAGAVDYLQKPFDAETIEEVVERVLDVGRSREENRAIAARLGGEERAGTLAGVGPATERVLVGVRAAAASRSTVLVTGESGTGKELVARALHEMSPRAGRPFVKVNCAAIPEGLLESELFGHERGAFTGAIRARAGHFEAASGGTLLLDELGEAGPAVQAKLLRVIQEREVMRIGDAKPLKVDVRLIATTNRDLAEEVRAGRFRGDLYYRINVIPIFLPPLRERRDEIPQLVAQFVTRKSGESGRRVTGVSDGAMARLMAHDWPGNVRELENVIERAVVMGRGPVVEASEVVIGSGEPPAGPAASGETMPSAAGTLEDAERNLILSTLREEGGNRTRTAARLGVSVRTIRNKLSRWRAMGAAIEEACRAS